MEKQEKLTGLVDVQFALQVFPHPHPFVFTRRRFLEMYNIVPRRPVAVRVKMEFIAAKTCGDIKEGIRRGLQQHSMWGPLFRV